METMVSGTSLTYNNEGSDDPKSPYYCRRPYVPGADNASGVTLGKGYDMKEKSVEKIKTDLTSAGLTSEQAELLSKASKLHGHAAREFVKKTDVQKIEITEDQEIKLFNISYVGLRDDVRRICEKADVTAKYGACNWNNVDAGIREYVVDLRYRGDYTPAIRRLIQKAIVSNDYDTLISVAKVRSHWGNVDSNRFNERIRYLQNAAVKYKSLLSPQQKILLPLRDDVRTNWF